MLKFKRKFRLLKVNLYEFKQWRLLLQIPRKFSSPFLSNTQNGSLGVTSDITPTVVQDRGAGAVLGAIGLLLEASELNTEKLLSSFSCGEKQSCKSMLTLPRFTACRPEASRGIDASFGARK